MRKYLKMSWLYVNKTALEEYKDNIGYFHGRELGRWEAEVGKKMFIISTLVPFEFWMIHNLKFVL